MGTILKIENYIRTNPQQAAQTLDRATKLFAGCVLAEVVGMGYFYPVIPKKIIWTAGVFSTVTGFFLLYVRRWIAKIEQEQIKINNVDDQGYTRLHHAMKDAPLDEIKLLLQQGANIHTKVENTDESQKEHWGNTPLHFAVRYGRLEVVNLLLERGCHILEENTATENSIHIAGYIGWKEIFDLLKEKANANDGGYYFYDTFYLAKYNYLEYLKLHMGKDVDVNTRDEDGFTLLHLAAQYGNLEIVKFLVTEGADKEATNNEQTPYMLAYFYGWKNIMEYLESQGVSTELGGTRFIWEYRVEWDGFFMGGANPSGKDAQSRTALHYIRRSSGVEAILKLDNFDKSLVKAADLNGDTPLHLVESVAVLEMLCKHGANVDVENKWGQTPLNCALERRNLKVAEALIAKEAKLNAAATNEAGEPFLHCFMWDMTNEGLELLKKICAKYELNYVLTNRKGETCHRVAADRYDEKIALFLLEQNTDAINVKDHLGQTPLHRACRKKTLKAALIEKGADPSLTDNEGLTAEDLARKKESERIAKERAHYRAVQYGRSNW